jgi:glycosyltransferase involved in cell wall biosynthesis
VSETREGSLPRVLAVLPCVPWPADSGGRLRTLHLVQALDAGCELTVVALRGGGDDLAGFRARLRADVRAAPAGLADFAAAGVRALTGDPLRYVRYAGPALGALVDRALRERTFDLVHFDHLHTAPLLERARTLQPSARLVVDEHNVESVIAFREAQRRSGLTRRAFLLAAGRLRRFEAHWIAQADEVLACSETDAAQLRDLGARVAHVVPNGVDLAAALPLPGVPRDSVVFVGSLDWRPNTDAALELAREVWPLAAPRLPGCRLVLVGRNPPAAVRAETGPSIQVTGNVPWVAPYLASAFATAVPLRSGSGTRLKLLEAAAAGVPMVATRLAAEGLPLADDEDVLFAETPAEMADALVWIREDPALARRLAARARRTARAFGWSAIGAALAARYAAATAERTAARRRRQPARPATWRAAGSASDDGGVTEPRG